MWKFMVLFRQPDKDAEAFENTYNDFLALVERMPAIERRQVVHVVGSPLGAPAYTRVLELYFHSRQQMELSLMSPPGQEAGKELNRFAPNSFDVLFAEVYEETGGSTAQQA